MKSKIIILGAGLAGLSAAYYLKKAKKDFEIFEKEARIGGLCRSEQVNGFIFDYTGHILHMRPGRVNSLIRNMLGEKLIFHKRQAGIYLKNKYIKYPFQAHIQDLPYLAAKECLLSFLEAQSKKKILAGTKDNLPKNFQEWLYSTFGKGIVRHFMLPYNRKFWAMDLRQMDWRPISKLIPQPGPDKMMEFILKKEDKEFGYNPVFWYPSNGGIETLAVEFGKKVKNIRLNNKAIRIWPLARRVRFRDNQKGNVREDDYQQLISTLPLPEIVHLTAKAPLEVRQAAAGLKYNSVLNINLGIDRPNISDKHWIYFPEKKFIFYRVGFPANFSMSLAPAGTSSIYTEISYSQDMLSGFNREEIVKTVVNHLIKAGILRRNDRILAANVLDIKYAYVIYDHNHRKNTGAILDYLSRHNIFSIGRYGRWEHLSMEEAVEDGRVAAEKISRP